MKQILISKAMPSTSTVTATGILSTGQRVFRSKPRMAPAAVCEATRSLGTTAQTGTGNTAIDESFWENGGKALRSLPYPGYRLVRRRTSLGKMTKKRNLNPSCRHCGGCHLPGFSVVSWKSPGFCARVHARGVMIVRLCEPQDLAPGRRLGFQRGVC